MCTRLKDDKSGSKIVFTKVRRRLNPSSDSLQVKVHSRRLKPKFAPVRIRGLPPAFEFRDRRRRSNPRFAAIRSHRRLHPRLAAIRGSLFESEVRGSSNLRMPPFISDDRRRAVRIRGSQQFKFEYHHMNPSFNAVQIRRWAPFKSKFCCNSIYESIFTFVQTRHERNTCSFLDNNFVQEKTNLNLAAPPSPPTM